MLSHKLKSVVSLMIVRNVLRDTPKTCLLIWIKACFFISIGYLLLVMFALLALLFCKEQKHRFVV